MKCDLPNRKELMRKYNNGLLSDEDDALFEKHCFNCDTCFQEIKNRDHEIALTKQERSELYDSYIEKINALKQKKESSGLWRSLAKWLSRADIQNRYRFVYASLIAGAVAAVLFLIFMTPKSERKILRENNIAEQADSIRQTQQIALRGGSGETEKITEKQVPDRKEMYAANFTPYPQYEYEIDATMRSTDYALDVISPEIGEHFDEAPHFRWNTDYEGSIYLEIFTNRDSLIYSALTGTNQLRVEKKLVPGLYYWKLKSEDDLMYLGKFMVGRKDN